jgi:hypothetical protein
MVRLQEPQAPPLTPQAWGLTAPTHTPWSQQVLHDGEQTQAPFWQVEPGSHCCPEGPHEQARSAPKIGGATQRSALVGSHTTQASPLPQFAAVTGLTHV